MATNYGLVQSPSFPVGRDGVAGRLIDITAGDAALRLATPLILMFPSSGLTPARTARELDATSTYISGFLATAMPFITLTSIIGSMIIFIIAYNTIRL